MSRRVFGGIIAVLVTATAALAQVTYNVGDKVEVFSPMSQTWVKGRIVAIDGARYMFQADDKSLPNDFWGTYPDKIRPISTARASTPNRAGSNLAARQLPPTSTAQTVGSCG